MNTALLPSATELDGPPPELLHRRRLRLVASARALWKARELAWTIAERDFLARYKQAVLGAAWAFLTPLILLGAFALFFQPVANIDTEGVPYALFALVGLVPWTFFSTAVNSGGTTLLSNRPLLKKVYCPREVFPIASVGVAGLDALISLSAAALLFGAFTFMPRPESVWVPLLLTIQVAFALGVAFFMSVVVVHLRDVRYLIPMILQLGLFATPIGYGIERIPASVRGLYSFANPLGPVIDGYRSTVLYGRGPDLELLGFGAAGAALYLVVGYLVFKRLEGGVADVA